MLWLLLAGFFALILLLAAILLPSLARVALLSWTGIQIAIKLVLIFFGFDSQSGRSISAKVAYFGIETMLGTAIGAAGIHVRRGILHLLPYGVQIVTFGCDRCDYVYLFHWPLEAHLPRILEIWRKEVRRGLARLKLRLELSRLRNQFLRASQFFVSLEKGSVARLPHASVLVEHADAGASAILRAESLYAALVDCYLFDVLVEDLRFHLLIIVDIRSQF